MNAKITRSAEAVEKVQSYVGKALEVLDHGFNGRIVNGYGVYTDVSTRKYDLAIALDELKKALTLMDTTAWPTNTDYDDAERPVIPTSRTVSKNSVQALNTMQPCHTGIGQLSATMCGNPQHE